LRGNRRRIHAVSPQEAAGHEVSIDSCLSNVRSHVIFSHYACFVISCDHVFLILVVSAASSAPRKKTWHSQPPSDFGLKLKPPFSGAYWRHRPKAALVEAIGNDASAFALLFHEVRDVMKKDQSLRRVGQSVGSRKIRTERSLKLDGLFPYVVSKRG
jgi:hypothetical protein